MSSRYVLLCLAGIVAAFAGGFLLANALNRSEIESLRTQVAARPDDNNGGDAHESKSELSDEEIQSKIREADSDPTNFRYQKNLGIALSRYASLKQDEKLLAEAIRIVDRAADLRNDDREILIAKGNAHFDFGLVKKENSEFQVARTAYEKALALKADDADVQTDLGLTYFLFDPPDIGKAETDFKKSLTIDPKHEKSLVFLIQALAKQQKQDEARLYLAKLKASHPDNDDISGLTAMIDNPSAPTAQ